VRNAVAVGGDPAQCAILDNFCWGNVTEPQMLGALVRTAEACRDVAIVLGTPFVSGKDSLNNSFITKDGKKISIPHTLLITAMAHVPDVTKCITMDLKSVGNKLYLVGHTKDELGGSHFHEVQGLSGGNVPKVDAVLAKEIFAAMHRVIRAGMVRSVHDCSEGGLAVALAEMCFAGDIGADITGLKTMNDLPDLVKVFSESPTRFVVEVTPEQEANFHAGFANLPLFYLGVTVAEKRLRIADSTGEWAIWTKLADLKEAWQKPLR
jgi:phosphoribosylformylglycinamidine synthase subunit PurSL